MSKAKVVFVRPPNLQKSGEWKKQGVIRCPLNLGMLASYIRESGNYDCSIVDFEVLPAETPFQMAEIILKQSPKYVCFTTLTPRFPVVVKISQEIMKLDSSVVTIVGGSHVTGTPMTSMYEGIKYGIVGEGETALLELIDTLEKKRDTGAIKNLLYRKDGKIKVNPVRPFIKDLDSLPFPAWDLMKIDEYEDPTYFGKGPHLALFTSRGCPYDCIFCASEVTWKKKLRFRSAESVVDEIRYIADTLKVKNIAFFDDSFAADRKRAIDICNRLTAENLNVHYSVQFRADYVSEELVNALKKSGCCFAGIGVESGNVDILKKIGKKETKDQFRRAIRIMKEANLTCFASYIFGHPGDTHETIKETMEFAFELDADQSKFMVLASYPGTQVYQLACRKGLVDPYSFQQMEASNFYDSVAVNLSNVSDDDLLRYQDEAYARF
ncbi:MAG: radical SAM protein, partial [bacterium]